MKRTKLKTKVALSVLFIFFGVMPIVAWGSPTCSKARLYQAIESQQTSLVAVVAGEPDERTAWFKRRSPARPEPHPAQVRVSLRIHPEDRFRQ